MNSLNQVAGHLKPTVLIIGSNGRIGKATVKTLRTTYNVVQLQRGKFQGESNEKIMHLLDPAGALVTDWKDCMKRSGASVVLNLAAQSNGSFLKMRKVNVVMPEQIAKACEELGIPMIHTSTSAADLPNLDAKIHPYAWTKQQAEQVLKDFPNVITLKFGAVLGGKSEVPVCTDAAVSTWSPLIMLPSGEDKEFYPIDEATVVKSLEQVVKHLAKSEKNSGISLPRTIEIAGKGVSLKEFLMMVNPSALGSVKVPDAVMKLLARIVNKGVFTEEFVSISKLVGSHSYKPVKPNTGPMVNELGIEQPSPEKIAAAARNQLSLFKTTKIVAESLSSHVLRHVVMLSGVWKRFLEASRESNA